MSLLTPSSRSFFFNNGDWNRLREILGHIGSDTLPRLEGAINDSFVPYTAADKAVNLNSQTFTTTGLGTFDDLISTSLSATAGVYTDGSKTLTDTIPTSGALGYWTRSGTEVTPANFEDNLQLDGSLTIGDPSDTTDNFLRDVRFSSYSPILGVTSEFFWNAGKAALAVGDTVIPHSDANMGENSINLGARKATGFRSVSIGSASETTASDAFSMGIDCRSTTTQSFSFGISCVASGESSIAFGLSASTTVARSIAIGISQRNDVVDSIQIGVSTTGTEFTGEIEVSDGTIVFNAAAGDVTVATGDTVLALGDLILTIGDITVGGLAASTGVYTDGSKVLTSTPPTSGTLGYWNRSGSVISTDTAGDTIKTTGTVITNIVNILGDESYSLFESDTVGQLALQNNTSSQQSRLGVFSADGDGTDFVNFDINAVGTPTQTINRERLVVGYNASDTRFEITTFADGTGVNRELAFEVGSNTDQFVLKTDGTIGSTATELLFTGAAGHTIKSFSGNTGQTLTFRAEGSGGITSMTLESDLFTGGELLLTPSFDNFRLATSSGDLHLAPFGDVRLDDNKIMAFGSAKDVPIKFDTTKLLITANSASSTHIRIDIGHSSNFNTGGFVRFGPSKSAISFFYPVTGNAVHRAADFGFDIVHGSNTMSSRLAGVFQNIRVGPTASASGPITELNNYEADTSMRWANATCTITEWNNYNCVANWIDDFAGTVVSLSAFHIEGWDSSISAGMGSITTAYGINFADITAGDSNYAIKTGLGLIDFGGGQLHPLVTKTSDYTITENDYTILLDGASNTVDATLPASPNTNQIFNVKCINAVNTCRLLRNGKNIDGDALDFTFLEDESLTLQYDGTEWWII